MTIVLAINAILALTVFVAVVGMHLLHARSEQPTVIAPAAQRPEVQVHIRHARAAHAERARAARAARSFGASPSSA